jgi:hypothetical protein
MSGRVSRHGDRHGMRRSLAEAKPGRRKESHFSRPELPVNRRPWAGMVGLSPAVSLMYRQSMSLRMGRPSQVRQGRHRRDVGRRRDSGGRTGVSEARRPAGPAQAALVALRMGVKSRLQAILRRLGILHPLMICSAGQDGVRKKVSRWLAQKASVAFLHRLPALTTRCRHVHLKAGFGPGRLWAWQNPTGKPPSPQPGWRPGDSGCTR